MGALGQFQQDKATMTKHNEGQHDVAVRPLLHACFSMDCVTAWSVQRCKLQLVFSRVERFTGLECADTLCHFALLGIQKMCKIIWMVLSHKTCCRRAVRSRKQCRCGWMSIPERLVLACRTLSSRS